MGLAPWARAQEPGRGSIARSVTGPILQVHAKLVRFTLRIEPRHERFTLVF